MDQSYQAPQGRFLPTLVVFAFVLGLLYTLFLFFQNWNVSRESKRLQAEIGDLNVELSALEDDQVELLYTAQLLKDEMKEELVTWSKVVQKLDDLTPVSVFFSSFSASPDGSLQLNGLGDSYRAVASTLQAIETSKDFSGEFTPSVTQGSTADGSEIVSFSLELNAEF